MAPLYTLELETKGHDVFSITTAFTFKKVREGSFTALVHTARDERTHSALGSYSAQILMNSSRWWAPRMEESRVR